MHADRHPKREYSFSTQSSTSTAFKADSPQTRPAPPAQPELPVSTAYPFTELEARWQDFWLRNRTFRTPDLGELDTSKPKAYILDMFPYPSGAGLHVGHPGVLTAAMEAARSWRAD